MSSINGYATLTKELDRVRDKTDKQEGEISLIHAEVAKIQEMYVYVMRELERIGNGLESTEKKVDKNTRKITIICAIASVVVIILSNLDKIIPYLAKGG